MLFPLRLETFAAGDYSVEFFVPDAVAVKEAYQKGWIPFPYWSQVWPAAKALAFFLLANPGYVREKTVLELGAGLGLPSLVAAGSASRVLCTDYVPEAVAIINRSAAHLSLQNFHAEVRDWRQMPADINPDVLLLSDINYEPEVFSTLQTIISAFLQKRTTVLLSTPQRLMAKDFIAPLLPFCTRQEEVAVQQEGTTVMTTVLVLEGEN